MSEGYACIHCGAVSPPEEWLEDGLVCPKCGGADDCPPSLAEADEAAAAHAGRWWCACDVGHAADEGPCSACGVGPKGRET
jgi:hypothetical protein